MGLEIDRRDLTNRVTTSFTSVRTDADLIQRREYLAAHTIIMRSDRESLSPGQVARTVAPSRGIRAHVPNT
jgi:hypothetical protein